MGKIEHGGRIRITTRLTQPWRRFIRLRAGGRNRIAHMEGGFGAWKTAKKPHIGTQMSTGAPTKVTY